MKIGSALMLVFGLAAIAPAQIPDFTPPTPLIGALLHNDTAEAKRLLAEGADPNESRFLGFPPVFLPVMHQNLDVLRAMVQQGADVQARDMSGSTALMWAAFNDKGETPIVDELLHLGLDPNATNQAGETALTWASRRGQTPVVSALEKAGSSNAAMIKDATQRAFALLEKSGPQFTKVSGCVSCHHQFLPQIAAGVARNRGFAFDQELMRSQYQAMIAMFKPLRQEVIRNRDRVPDPPITVSYALLALGADAYPADETTEAMAQLIAHVQEQDGSFRAFGIRPPIESSSFSATALSIRALQLYGNNVDEKVARALAWLRSTSTNTSEDRAMQLMGLVWAKAGSEVIREKAHNILAEQQSDGGWAQLPSLGTDAYATGQALVALNWAGVPTSHPAYRRGIAYLLRTQFADGSWLVRTRAFPFQRYKESGFPHGKDQWISAAGTSWAAMALSLAVPTQKEQAD